MTINSYKLTADVQSYLDTVYSAMERDEWALTHRELVTE